MATITNAEAASAIPAIVARAIQPILRANTVIPQLIGRDYDTEIANDGDRVTINKLGALTVSPKVQGSPVTIQAPSTSGTTIVLGQYETTFGIDNVTNIVTRPNLMMGYAEAAGIAMAEHINADIASIVWPLAGNTLALGPLTADTFYDANRLLNVGKLIQGDRSAVLGTDANREANNIDEFVTYDYQGPPAWTALRTGNMGTLSSFNTFMSQGITETGGEVKNLFFQKRAIELVTRVLDTSMNNNGGFATTMVDDGVGGTGLTFRVLVWFDWEIQRWIMTVDSLYGVGVVEPAGVVVAPTVDV